MRRIAVERDEIGQAQIVMYILQKALLDACSNALKLHPAVGTDAASGMTLMTFRQVLMPVRAFTFLHTDWISRL